MLILEVLMNSKKSFSSQKCDSRVAISVFSLLEKILARHACNDQKSKQRINMQQN